MSVRHLFSQLSFRRQFTISSKQLRLVPTFSAANSLLSRSYGIAAGKLPRNEAIASLGQEVHFIDADGAFQGLKSLEPLLASFDREIYHLICINPQVAPEPVLCRLYSKEQLEEDEKAAYWMKKEKKQGNKDPTKVVKKVEISWATAPNDLEHKLKRIDEFLQRGNRVEVILGTRKGMAKQTPEKVAGLVERIRKEAEKSGKEWKVAEGVIGVQYLIYLEGKRPKKRPVEERKPMRRRRGTMEEGKAAEEGEPTGEGEAVEERWVAEEGKVAGEEGPTGEGKAGQEGGAVNEENVVGELEVTAEPRATEGAAVVEEPMTTEEGKKM